MSQQSASSEGKALVGLAALKTGGHASGDLGVLRATS
jgi:hypothetical protein